MTRAIKRLLVLLSGWFFLLLGIIGLFLPVLQGILFIAIGLTILSSEYEWSRRLLNKLTARFPKFSQAAKNASLKADLWLKRIFKSRETQG